MAFISLEVHSAAEKLKHFDHVVFRASLTGLLYGGDRSDQHAFPPLRIIVNRIPCRVVCSALMLSCTLFRTCGFPACLAKEAAEAHFLGICMIFEAFIDLAGRRAKSRQKALEQLSSIDLQGLWSRASMMPVQQITGDCLHHPPANLPKVLATSWLTQSGAVWTSHLYSILYEVASCLP